MDQADMIQELQLQLIESRAALYKLVSLLENKHGMHLNDIQLEIGMAIIPLPDSELDLIQGDCTDFDDSPEMELDEGAWERKQERKADAAFDLACEKFHDYPPEFF